MFHTQNNIDAMTADELINGIRNNTIEGLPKLRMCCVLSRA